MGRPQRIRARRCALPRGRSPRRVPECACARFPTRTRARSPMGSCRPPGMLRRRPPSPQGARHTSWTSRRCTAPPITRSGRSLATRRRPWILPRSRRASRPPWARAVRLHSAARTTRWPRPPSAAWWRAAWWHAQGGCARTWARAPAAGRSGCATKSPTRARWPWPRAPRTTRAGTCGRSTPQSSSSLPCHRTRHTSGSSSRRARTARRARSSRRDSPRAAAAGSWTCCAATPTSTRDRSRASFARSRRSARAAARWSCP
mmetsp:Transcript_14665/g.61163  ORF Transcript_14665/g.61163 Transcript_14665/m.61163 type:complete len:260 (-) Transcript_14665:423-1202(-)